MIIKDLFAKSYRGNIVKIFAYHLLTGMIFFFPIWVLFLQDYRGFSLAQVTYSDVAFWGTMMLAEIPTGVVADTIGRKTSMVISLALGLVSVNLFALVTTFPLIMLANSLWAISLTFNSGADVALFYESLKQLGREEEYTKLRGQLSAVGLGANALGSALGGIIAAKNLQLPFLIYGGFTFVTLLLSFRLKEPPFEADQETGKRIAYREALKITAGAIKKRPQLRYALLFSSFLPLSFFMTEILFMQPFAVSIGIPIASIGFILFAIRGMRMIGAANADKAAKQGQWRWFARMPWLIFFGLFAMGRFNSWHGIIFVALAGGFISLVQPMLEEIIQKNAPNAVRATILSISAMLFLLVLTVIESGIGFLPDRIGLLNTFYVLAALPLVSLIPILILWKPIWLQKKAETVPTP